MKRTRKTAITETATPEKPLNRVDIAIQQYLNQQMSAAMAAQFCGLKKSTFLYRVKKGAKIRPRAGRPLALGDMEKELVQWIILRALEGRPVFPKQLKDQACKIWKDLPGASGIFSAGDDWYRAFLLRHPSIVRTVLKTRTKPRIANFNSMTIATFMELVEELYKQGGYEAKEIFNEDDTNIGSVFLDSVALTVKLVRRVAARAPAPRRMSCRVPWWPQGGEHLPWHLFRGLPNLWSPRSRKLVSRMTTTWWALGTRQQPAVGLSKTPTHQKTPTLTQPRTNVPTKPGPCVLAGGKQKEHPFYFCPLYLRCQK